MGRDPIQSNTYGEACSARTHLQVTHTHAYIHTQSHAPEWSHVCTVAWWKYHKTSFFKNTNGFLLWLHFWYFFTATLRFRSCRKKSFIAVVGLPNRESNPCFPHLSPRHPKSLDGSSPDLLRVIMENNIIKVKLYIGNVCALTLCRKVWREVLPTSCYSRTQCRYMYMHMSYFVSIYMCICTSRGIMEQKGGNKKLSRWCIYKISSVSQWNTVWG